VRNPLEKRLFWISVGLHIFVLAIIAFSHQDSRIKKTFLAYGRHSKRILHAYFRQLKSPINTSQKYLQARRAKNRKAEACRAEARKAKARKANKKKNKKPVKKRVFKKKQNKIVKNKLVKKTPKKVPKPEKLETEKPDEVVEEVLDFNLMGEKDPKMILCQRCIQSEVDRVWKPPIGVEKGTECVVHFVINRDGCVKNCKIIKSSNVLIYDLSIVQVTKKFAFDKCLWGKSFDINFRQ
jgi:outer membrane biosynthesis protein TonB